MSTELDKLMDLLEKRVEEKRKTVKQNKLDSCDRFVTKHKIKQGSLRIPVFVIFYTYMKVYKAAPLEEKWSRRHFFRLFKKKFEQRRTGKQRYYLLDADCFDMSREGKLRAKKYDEEYRRNIKIKRGTLNVTKKRK